MCALPSVTVLSVFARIHRGSSEVGGNCVELEAGGSRLMLDIGLPLSAEPGDGTALPSIAGLSGGDRTLVGVVLSHAHPDHYGLVREVDGSVPIYAGSATTLILREAAFFTRSGANLQLAGELRSGEPLDIGPFLVTPFLVDHSAFDAYALLVEAGGRKLFYTGDIRFHGRKSEMLERLLASPPEAVHVLLMEGTLVGSSSAAGYASSEKDVEEEACRFFQGTDGIALCMFSPQNVDRLVSLFRAAKRAGRKFVYDLYAASVARATQRPKTIPQPEWPEVCVYVPNVQRVRVKASGEFERVNGIRNSRIFADELAGDPARYALLYRASMGPELEKAGCLGGARALWSQWQGYLAEPSGKRTQAWLAEHGIPLTVIHASGHATVADLRRLAAAFSGARLVPIHTDHPEQFAGEFGRAELHTDGEWWTV
jgi:ribonuclease J